MFCLGEKTSQPLDALHVLTQNLRVLSLLPILCSFSTQKSQERTSASQGLSLVHPNEVHDIHTHCHVSDCIYIIIRPLSLSQENPQCNVFHSFQNLYFTSFSLRERSFGECRRKDISRSHSVSHVQNSKCSSWWKILPEGN